MSMTTPAPPPLVAWVAPRLPRVGLGLALAGALFLVAALVIGFRYEIAYRPGLLSFTAALAILAVVGLTLGSGALVAGSGNGDNRSSARALLLAVGGVAGLTITVLGVIWFAVYFDKLEGWLKFGRRDQAWRVLLALATMLTGLATMFAAVQVVRGEERTSPGLRRLMYGYNAAFAGFLLLLIVLVVNVLVAARVPSVIDCTGTGQFTLSEQGGNIVAGLTKPTKLYLLMGEEWGLVYDQMKTLVRQCQERNPRVEVEQVPVTVASGKVRELANKFPQIGNQQGLLVVYGEETAGNASFIRAADLENAEFDQTSRQRTPKFQGETKLMAELASLSENKQKPVVYVTQGADEPDLADSTGPGGLGSLAKQMGERNFEVKPLLFAGLKPEVPADASVVVVAGPRRTLAPAAVLALKAFTAPARNGKLVVLLETPAENREGRMPPTGLESLLDEVGVTVTDERVIPALALEDETGRRLDPELVPGGMNARSENPVVVAFRRSRVAMTGVRLMKLKPGGPARIDVLVAAITTQYPCVAEGNLQLTATQVQEAIEKNFAAAQDRVLASVPLVVTVTEGGGPSFPGGPPPAAGKPKLVVAADAGWLTNRDADPRAKRPNAEIFIGLVNWLRDRATNIGVPPRSYQFYAPAPATNFSRMVLLDPALVLLAIGGIGAGVWVARRT